MLASGHTVSRRLSCSIFITSSSFCRFSVRLEAISADIFLHAKQNGDKAQYKIVDAKILVTRGKPRDEITRGIFDKWREMGKIQYGFNRFQLRGPFCVEKGSTNFERVVYSGTRPQAAFLFIVKNSAMEAKTENPFVFEHLK